ncbi:plant cysteine oxidase 3 [Amborella trichopoda]|uniref:plant cysteine oxidase 3 n=1 Tax=Amborella trichopoda TaxID=13333 RepID=UPI0005D365BB|nr:plant cysteine oxidase 3 [Amborella trichopoda]|eukprot:XP_011623281.1 plant cysteine oxidase 3 [Amborella trichopoda]
MGKSSVQALYDLCKKTFTSSTPTPPPSHSIRKLSALMDAFEPEDVGLREDSSEDRGHGCFGQNRLMNNLSTRLARWAQPITYLHIHECNNFTIGIFCLPTSSGIPLHDHPGMTVWSKVLYGSMHVKSYDWVEPACIRTEANSQLRLAKLRVDNVLTAPCETSVLFPRSGGNIHCFTAITSCAVLDVLAPPYSEAAGRNCTYYNDYPLSSLENGFDLHDEESFAWLEEVEAPDDFYIRSGKYKGPAVQP